MPLTRPVYPPLSLQNRFSKDGLSSALGVRSKEIGMSPFSMHFIRVLLPEVQFFFFFFLPQPRTSTTQCFGSVFWDTNEMRCKCRCLRSLMLAKRHCEFLCCKTFHFFCACHDFCLKKHNPLFIFPLCLPRWKEIELFKNSLGKQNKKRGGGGKRLGEKK